MGRNEWQSCVEKLSSSSDHLNSIELGRKPRRPLSGVATRCPTRGVKCSVGDN